MGQLRLYMAMSLDGFAALSDGNVDWLADYPATDLGFAEFLSGIDLLLMGRATYEQALGFGEWPYPAKRTFVLTSGELKGLPDRVEVWRDTLPALMDAVIAPAAGDCWLVGGPETIHRAFAADLIGRMELFVVPRLLGEGLPLFSWAAGPRSPVLNRSVAFPNGVVLSDYRIDRTQPRPDQATP
jgi:dihydrofolate reductase